MCLPLVSHALLQYTLFYHYYNFDFLAECVSGASCESSLSVIVSTSFICNDYVNDLCRSCAQVGPHNGGQIAELIPVGHDLSNLTN